MKSDVTGCFDVNCDATASLLHRHHRCHALIGYTQHLPLPTHHPATQSLRLRTSNLGSINATSDTDDANSGHDHHHCHYHLPHGHHHVYHSYPHTHPHHCHYHQITAVIN